MKKVLQIISQAVFLILFALLFITGKIQFWLAAFVLGLIFSVFLGRVYCGWACPINTLTQSISWMKRKLRLKSIKIPRFLAKPWIRYLLLGLFIVIFILTMITGIKLPVLPSLLVIGVALSLFFSEQLWHRYLCPYGALLHLSSKKPIYFMAIDQDKCNRCGVCKSICSGGAIDKTDKGYIIVKNTCLACFECARKCKQKAISYTRS